MLFGLQQLLATCFENIACTGFCFIYFVEFISLAQARLCSYLLRHFHTNSELYPLAWNTNFESFMCTTSFPSRSIEMFCLLFSSFYDLTPKGHRGNAGTKKTWGEIRKMPGAPGKRLPGSLATWSMATWSLQGGPMTIIIVKIMFSKNYSCPLVAGAREPVLGNAFPQLFLFGNC